MAKDIAPLITVDEAGRRLGVSVSTVWRLIRRGAVHSVRQGGRRLIPETAIFRRLRAAEARDIPPLTRDHPLFQLIGAGRGGGGAPGARDKHGVLDR